jgi:CBS domain containing-hemolysin-like protein
MRDDARLLITLMIGSNLALELLTLLAESTLGRSPLPASVHELSAALLVTPLVFLFGELIPKDLFRRRPHSLLGLVAPVIQAFRWLASPLAWPLALLSVALERLLGLRQEDFARILRREEMVELLAEGRRAGALTREVEELAHNVLVLRHTPLARVAVPWERVECADLDRGEAAARAALERSGFSRLPALQTGPDRKRVVVGYLHQLDVLGSAPGVSLAGSLRPILELAADLPLDRAVARLQAAGQRLAVVGSLRAPRGLVSLMDLLMALAGPPRFPQPVPTARIGSAS